MRIKLPLIEIETEKDCPCSSYEEYEIKIKCAKLKLHGKYLLTITSMICIWLFTILTYGDDNFAAEMSFASTIASIILSVLAIIMSITGEGKTEHIKEQLEATAGEIKKSQETVNNINESIEDNLQKLKIQIDVLSDRIEHISDETAEKVRQFSSGITSDMSSDVSEGIEI